MKKITLFVYALAGGLLWGGMSVKAQQRIQMTTSRSAGEQLSFSLDKNATVEVDWGNGTPVTCTADAAGVVTGTLAGETVVLEGDFSELDCNGCNLTGLVLTDAPALKSLICNDNELTELTLTKNKALSLLDCANNQLPKLSAPTSSSLLYLDCSHNQLTSLSLTNMKKLEVLICSDNALAALTPSNAPLLKTLWCDNNQIKTLTLSSNALESVVCSGNSLTTLNTKESANTKLVDFWAGNNGVKKLNLGGSTGLRALECSNNGLTELLLTVPDEKLLCCYLDNNALPLTSMFATSLVDGAYTVDNQAPFSLYNTNKQEISAIKVGEGVTFTAMPHPIGDEKKVTSYSWYTTDGETKLVSGSRQDYTRTSSTNTFTFKKPFASIYCAVTNAAVTGLTLKSKPLKVYEEGMSIAQVMKEKGFRFSTESNAILMNADEDLKVVIYTTDGKAVWSGTVGEHGVRVPLNGGAVYLVNGIKVAL